ncbi:hypothetical protein RSA_05440 [Rickettsia philipii str. 364D]|uniref:Uncharacterized protein n=1 Tax=Rickettsia philipii (strain 364D) TaxID=481009 RepID=H6PUQ6_RICP3|nr:hypothetical protein RSA_05440 [Rickettsia philipii str. 364D]
MELWHAIVASIILLAINPSTLAVVLLKRIFPVTLLIFFILPHFEVLILFIILDVLELFCALYSLL